MPHGCQMKNKCIISEPVNKSAENNSRSALGPKYTNVHHTPNSK